LVAEREKLLRSNTNTLWVWMELSRLLGARLVTDWFRMREDVKRNRVNFKARGEKLFNQKGVRRGSRDLGVLYKGGAVK